MSFQSPTDDEVKDMPQKQRKNPENKPLRIVRVFNELGGIKGYIQYGEMLTGLAIAQSNLVKAGKDSALPHFIAIVKELELLYGFQFEIMEDAG